MPADDIIIPRHVQRRIDERKEAQQGSKPRKTTDADKATPVKQPAKSMEDKNATD
jgi:hypothetical protein